MILDAFTYSILAVVAMMTVVVIHLARAKTVARKADKNQ